MDMISDTLCPGCFAAKGRANPCPHCGYDETVARGPLPLPHHTLLHGQYLVGRVLGKPGGFGITYLGWDRHLEMRVAIKEYLPRDLAGRASDGATVAMHSQEEGEAFRYGLEQFLREARTLAQLDHPNIVRVRYFFEANGTAYLVMDYYQGQTLDEYVEQQGGRLPEEQARQLMLPILDGLRAVHAKGFLHRDIKPQNLYLARLESGGVRPILLDFGTARQAMGEHSRSLSVVLTPGYAPFEQYHRKGKQGPWTDVYAAAAVLYRMVTGVEPPEATERREEDELKPAAQFGVSAELSAALGAGLAIAPESRLQTVQAFQGLLAASEPTHPKQDVQAQAPSVRSDEIASYLPQQKLHEGYVAPGQNTQYRPWLFFAIVLGITVIGVGAYWVVKQLPSLNPIVVNDDLALGSQPLTKDRLVSRDSTNSPEPSEAPAENTSSTSVEFSHVDVPELKPSNSASIKSDQANTGNIANEHPNASLYKESDSGRNLNAPQEQSKFPESQAILPGHNPSCIENIADLERSFIESLERFALIKSDDRDPAKTILDKILLSMEGDQKCRWNGVLADRSLIKTDGYHRISDRYVDLAEIELGKGKYDSVHQWLLVAEEFDSKNPRIKSLRASLTPATNREINSDQKSCNFIAQKNSDPDFKSAFISEDLKLIMATGNQYESNASFENNIEKAICLYLKAARFGVVDAYYRLGVIFAYGKGGKKDINQARKWFTLAANNHAMARTQLKLLKLR